jgi:hypothetical protein
MIRALLLWLLVLALPVQGALAARTDGCPPAHHDRTIAVTAAHAPSAMHCHQRGGAHDPLAAGATDADAGTGALVQADPGQCSAGASCCPAAAITGAPPSLPAFDAAAAEFAVPASAVRALVLGGPERPPRAPRS